MMTKKIITLNSGEWAECFAKFKIIADERLEICNVNLDKTGEIISIIGGVISDHKYNIVNDTIIINDKTIPKEIFKNFASQILEQIQFSKTSKINTYSIKGLDEFLTHITNINFLKSDAHSKADTIFIIDDELLGQADYSFSIKSFLGDNPTLINASKQTNFEFKVTKEIDDNFLDAKVSEKIKTLGLNGLKFSKIDSQNYNDNIQMIDTQLPEMLGYALIEFYGNVGGSYNKICDKIISQNPLNLSNPEIYRHKFIDFLFYSCVGMFPSKPWNGRSDIDGGTIIVKKTGDIVCFYIVRKQCLQNFREYLYQNAYFETASTKRHKFGNFYEKDNKKYIKLNLQVRLRYKK